MSHILIFTNFLRKTTFSKELVCLVCRLEFYVKVFQDDISEIISSSTLLEYLMIEIKYMIEIGNSLKNPIF